MREQTPRRPYPGGRKTLEAHLEELARAWGVGFVPKEGIFLIVAADRAAEEMSRARQAHRAEVAAAERLGQAVLAPAPVAIFQLAEALSRDTGLAVVPSEKAWAARIPAAGETWKNILEALPAHGFRWLLKDQTVYIDR